MHFSYEPLSSNEIIEQMDLRQVQFYLSNSIHIISCHYYSFWSLQNSFKRHKKERLVKAS